MAKAGEYALLGDVPVRESERGDLLDMSAYAKVLARATIETRDSITIGVFGKWGTGKTSLMRLIQHEVGNDKKAVAVWFNAWQYEKEEHLIVPLTATINKQLDEQAGKWSGEIAKGAKRLRDALRAIAYGFSIKGKVGIPLISEAEVNLSAKDMIERGRELAKDSVLERSLYFDAFEQLEQCAKAGGTAPRIVVFVDDLDRCFPPKAVELLEGIKLVLNQPGFSFVLGVNAEIIQAFIRSKYARECNIDGSHFDDYLDKIVQVKVPVPAREPGEMTEYIGRLLTEGKVFPKESADDLVPLIAEAGQRNPRSIVRLLNRIMVTVRIGELEGKDTYDPLALLLHIATDEPKYRRFVRALDHPVELDSGDSDKKRSLTIGEYLADLLDRSAVIPGTLIEDLRDTHVTGTEAELKNAVETLEGNEHLWRLLKSEIGRKWLAKTAFRHKLGQASERTLGERRKGDDKTTGLDDPIQQLEENMVRIEGGTFQMGSTEKEREQPVHSVTLEGFAISAMPVTQAQYQAIMGKNPSGFKGADHPVEQVSWDDAVAFCKRLSERTGREYTLPSEAQWEYACRAGSTGRYCFGDDESELGDYAWYDKNSKGTTHPVGRKKPNDWGLYDMHGNVWEWVEDDWHGSYEGAPADGQAWIDSPGRGVHRVIRGGGWIGNAGRCRCACRGRWGPGARYGQGFRLVLAPRSVSGGRR